MTNQDEATLTFQPGDVYMYSNIFEMPIAWVRGEETWRPKDGGNMEIHDPYVNKQLTKERRGKHPHVLVRNQKIIHPPDLAPTP